MKIANLPTTKFPIPFANAAGPGFVTTIPVASQIGITDGAASLTDGFPPLNFQPVGSGGVPPFGQDMNGILKEITAWTSWANAGGLVPFDSAFATAIGGYPRGAVLAGNSAGNVWLSLADDNVTNPSAGGPNWILVATSSAVQTGSYVYSAAGGTANALTATLVPAPTAYVAGMEISVKLTAPNTGATTINVNALGVKPVTRADGTALQANDLLAGMMVTLAYDGTNFQVSGLNPANIPADGVAVFAAAGTFTWTCPPGIYKAQSSVWGAGGGGGWGATATGVNGSGGGGGGAGFAFGSYNVVPGTNYTITVGAVGAGAVVGVTGSTAGGSSSFASFCSATGGAGGSNGTGAGAAGGNSGSGTGGQWNQDGRGGQSGLSAFPLGGAGGSTHNSGYNTNSIGVGASSSTAGQGGTGGTATTASGNQSGGNGATGLVILEF